MYKEEDFRTLLEIYNFSYCKRHWALHFLEDTFEHNALTSEGTIMHDKVHDKDKIEKRNGLLLVRGMTVKSFELGVMGVCDLVEFHSDENGVVLFNREGKWLPFPVEYKRSDRSAEGSKLQLCGQAMCLEEMLCCKIEYGALYYIKNKYREQVYFSAEMKNEVKNILNEIHRLYKGKHTPMVKYSKKCKSCALAEYCLPKMFKYKSVKHYIWGALGKNEKNS